jgi:uncharacterized repeat protein (TIGR03843 family)
MLEILSRAEVTDCKLLPFGSNYVFLISMSDSDAGTGFAVYKPRRGEAPLWDFPDGSLYRRERAAFILAAELGWDFIPPTVVREGPYGIGSVQLFVDNDENANFFTLRDAYADEMRRMAVFDVIANNADRKGGHCLLAPDGRIWGIDHGLTFHEMNKLRTVIWDFSEEPVPQPLLDDVAALSGRLSQDSTASRALAELLHPSEITALRNRLRDLLRRPFYPRPEMRRSVPWPPI